MAKVIGAVLAFLILAAMCSGEESTQSAAESTAPQAASAASAAPAAPAVPATPAVRARLQPDWQAFARGWNDVSERHITGIATKNGLATIDIGHGQTLALTENPDGSLREVLLGLSSSNPVDVITFMGNTAALIAGAQPQLTPEQRGQILRGLRLVGDDQDFDFSDEKGAREHRVGNVKYWTILVPGMGLILGAAPFDL